MPERERRAKIGEAKEVLPMKAILIPTPKTHEQRDNHRPGRWDASMVTTHQKG
jgi:hypothetical protein